MVRSNRKLAKAWMWMDDAVLAWSLTAARADDVIARILCSTLDRGVTPRPGLHSLPCLALPTEPLVLRLQSRPDVFLIEAIDEPPWPLLFYPSPSVSASPFAATEGFSPSASCQARSTLRSLHTCWQLHHRRGACLLASFFAAQCGLPQLLNHPRAPHPMI